jgi:hypothetical protein
LEIGVGWSKSFGDWSVLAGVEGGALFGALGEAGFDAFTASPAVRPVLALGHAFGDVHASLRGEMVFASPQYVRVGTASSTAPPPDPLAASSLGLIVENPLDSGGIWYFGAAVMAARAYYQVWVLFGDNPALLVYPRLLGGYVF